MKNITLSFLLIFGLSACNEDTSEISESPEKSTITETRYESKVNEALDDEVKTPNTEAPNFSFRESFTENTPSAETPNTESNKETNTVEATSTPTAEAMPVTSSTETASAQPVVSQTLKTANVVNLPPNDTLNVRQRAGTNNTILEKLPPNSTVMITGESNKTKDGQQWLEIITEKNIKGWVNDHYLKPNP